MNVVMFFSMLLITVISPRIGGAIVFIFGIWYIISLRLKILPALEQRDVRACPKCESLDCDYGYDPDDEDHVQEFGTCKKCGTEFAVQTVDEVQREIQQLRSSQSVFVLTSIISFFVMLKAWGMF